MTVLLVLASFVFLPAVVAFVCASSLVSHAPKAAFRIGAPIIYQYEEMSTRPTADARDIRPAERGEFYYYSIINYLRVTEVLGDGRIIAVARNDERLCFWPDEAGLRKARLSERLIHRPRFPHA